MNFLTSKSLGSVSLLISFALFTGGGSMGSAFAAEATAHKFTKDQ